jgi:glycosyltransferase involved in cell wall biosynthesis
VTPPRVAVFVSFSGAGGVERMIINLVRGFAAAGVGVDLLLVKARSAHLEELPPEVNVIRLAGGHTLTSLFALAGYLRRNRPQALLAAKDRAGRVAVLARMLSAVPVRLAIRIGTTVSGALRDAGALKRWWWFSGMRLFYRRADAVIAVSQGVADDIAAITGLDPRRIEVVANPVVTPALAAKAAEPVDHPWLTGEGPPVIMGAGRLTRQKDFATLLRAFARVRSQRPCRLLILGDGRERAELERLARELGVAADVGLPGFVSNPYAYMARARLFVLSSRWEGSPNVLTEALALGVPVVATDCPSGPREILRQGEVGPLVEVGDVDAMAAAMLEQLAAPAQPARLREATAEYAVEVSVARYLEVLGIKPR